MAPLPLQQLAAAAAAADTDKSLCLSALIPTSNGSTQNFVLISLRGSLHVNEALSEITIYPWSGAAVLAFPDPSISRNSAWCQGPTIKRPTAGSTESASCKESGAPAPTCLPRGSVGLVFTGTEINRIMMEHGVW